MVSRREKSLQVRGKEYNNLSGDREIPVRTNREIMPLLRGIRYCCLSKTVITVGTLLCSIALFPSTAVALTPSNSKSSSLQGRRTFFTSTAACVVVGTGLTPEDAHAVQGAAEYDIEYYLRDLFNGNKGKETKGVLAGPPPLPARKMTIPAYLLDKECSSSCVIGEELAKSSGETSTKISALVTEYRDKSRRAFQSRYPSKEDSISDQYFFDLTSYAVWRTASILIPNFVDRDKFARNVGRKLVREMRNDGLLHAKLEKVDGRMRPTDSMLAVDELLDAFKNFGLVSTYYMGERDKEAIRAKSKENSNSIKPLFDEFDNDDYQSGLSINALVSVIQPATLGASLQINGEGSRFSPDFIGCSLAALWEEAGARVSFETYFVDQEYRPNPKDYFPDEQLLQFTISPSR